MNIRITNKMMTDTFLDNLYGNINKMQRYQNQLATGKLLTRASDDPAGAFTGLKTRSKLTAITQYERNVSAGEKWTKQVESNLMDMDTIFKRAYELAVQVTSDTYNPDDKSKVSSELAQMMEELLDLANGQVVDQYMFGGNQVGERPFTLDSNGYILYKGTGMQAGDISPASAERDQHLNIEIGYGEYINTSFNGIELMGEGANNLYNMLKDFTDQLNNPNVKFDDLSPFITKFQDAEKSILAKAANIGGRSKRLEMASNRYASDKLIYEEVKSKIEDVSEAEAIMNFQMANAVYNSALSVGAKILQNSLLDYIR